MSTDTVSSAAVRPAITTRVLRGAASASVSVTGTAVVLLASMTLLAGVGSFYDLLLVGLGLVVGFVLFGAGLALYVFSEALTTEHVTRVAGWNALGVVVLGVVLALVVASPSVSIPGYVVADILGVSAVAHVLIGVTDVRRIRVGELAREREKLAVLNRITRHNLRNDTQVMLGYAEALAHRAPDEESRQMAHRLSEKADALATMNEKLGHFQAAVEQSEARRAIPLSEVVDTVVASVESSHPDASITVDVPDIDVLAGENLATAIEEAIENGIEHGGAVTVSATVVDGEAVLQVRDDGDGIPDDELTPLDESHEITQLEHGTGLGLWILKTIVDSYDGELSFSATADGTTVEIALPTA